MDSGDGSVPKRRTRQQSLKYMVELIDKRNRLSRSGNPTTCSVNVINIEDNVTCGRKRKLVEPSRGDNRKSEDDASMVRKGRRKFSPGTCESITKRLFVDEISGDDDDDDDSSEEESDPDVVIIEEEEAVESESETSSDGDNDDLKDDKDYRASSSSSQSDDEELEDDGVSCPQLSDTTTSSESSDFETSESSSSSSQSDESEDDDVSCPVEEKNNEEGKKESNGGLVPQLAVDGEKHNKRRAYFLRPRLLSRSKKKKLNCENCSSPILLGDDEESKSSSEEGREVNDSVQNVVKFVADSTIHVDAHDNFTPPEKKEQVPVKETLPLVFQFEDEEPLPPEKEEWEKEIDDLFVKMDKSILESDIGITNPSISPMQSGQISGCEMGNHDFVLDEQIGLICKLCSHVLENKYIFPPFAERTRGRHGRYVDGFRFSDSSADQDSPNSSDEF